MIIKVNLNNYVKIISQFTLLDGWKELKKGLNISSIQIGTKYWILISGQKPLLKSYSASVLDLELNWCWQVTTISKITHLGKLVVDLNIFYQTRKKCMLLLLPCPLTASTFAPQQMSRISKSKQSQLKLRALVKWRTLFYQLIR